MLTPDLNGPLGSPPFVTSARRPTLAPPLEGIASTLQITGVRGLSHQFFKGTGTLSLLAGDLFQSDVVCLPKIVQPRNDLIQVYFKNLGLSDWPPTRHAFDPPRIDFRPTSPAFHGLPAFPRGKLSVNKLFTCLVNKIRIVYPLVNFFCCVFSIT